VALPPTPHLSFEDLDATVHLPSIGCELKVSEIYDGIDFTAAH